LPIIFEVRSITHEGTPHSWGARLTRAEAETLLVDRFTGKNQEWAERHHKEWWIEEIDNTGLFEIPALPKPREKFSTQIQEVETGEGTWNTLSVSILDTSKQIVASYDRNHANLYQTFEPFRQGDKSLALVSADYTATSVIDLGTGRVIAAEEPHELGFCPAGFYVPDWWDVHDGSTLPGSTHWDEGLEEPVGNFGFVWGCVWGDDSSWKVQFLDLSQVQGGKITRDDRFGYVELAVDNRLEARDFIQCEFYNGKCTVTFSTLQSFDVRTGAHNPKEPE